MITPEWLIQSFAINQRVLDRLTEDFTQADSLLTPPDGGNCANWVVGHILVSRNRSHALLDLPPIWDEATAAHLQVARYQTGTDPITPDEDVYALADMLADFARSTTQITEALAHTTAEALAVVVDDQAVGQAIMGLHWHETYHIGGLEYLRHVAGKHEKVFG